MPHELLYIIQFSSEAIMQKLSGFHPLSSVFKYCNSATATTMDTTPINQILN